MSELLNSHVLKPETVKAVEAAGLLVVEIVDSWAGGWPAATRKLEKDDRLVQEAQNQVEREHEARIYQWDHPELYLSRSEALEKFDIPLHPPA